MDTISLLLVFLVYITIFILGIVIGYMYGTKNKNIELVTSNPNKIEKQSNNYEIKNIVPEENKRKMSKISIDDTIYVTDTSVKGVTKFCDNIYKTQHIEDNIDNNINKLKNLKGDSNG